MLSGQLHPFTRASYTSMHQSQHQAIQQVCSKPLKPLMFLGTHDHVVTLGRGSHDSNLLAVQPQGLMQPEQVKIERGGDVTYHGPGQLVGYPIIHLDHIEPKRDLHAYLRSLEEVLIISLSELGITAGRRSGLTGVWVGENFERKIASIGIAVKKWVTYHGFAINVTTDLRYFSFLNPCGLDAGLMTSVEKETDESVSIDTFAPLVLRAFKDVFRIDFKECRSLVASTPSVSHQN